jgi:hypothetical protein
VTDEATIVRFINQEATMIRSLSLLLSILVVVSSFMVMVIEAKNYTNPIVNVNAPDPGVLFYNGHYYMVTTSGNDVNAFPIRVSTDLVEWKVHGFVFPTWSSSKNPSWAKSDFWAPELHQVGPNRVSLTFTCIFLCCIELSHHTQCMVPSSMFILQHALIMVYYQLV